MLKRLKDRGLKICVWINPYIAQKSSLFAEGKANGYLLKRPDGSVWQWERWQAGMGIVDFTNPAARAWYQSKLKELLDMGVDCFKTDFGERIPTDVVYFDGSDPIRMHNYYAQLYNKAVFELLEENRGKNEAMLFARSATVGGQKYPVHWGGDCSANYGSMAESLRGGLSLCSSGFGFWSHDISGFENTASPDIYKRWSAFGLLSTHSRLHGNESYRVPWLFDEEAVDVLRFFTKLKCKLMPYLFAAACETAQKGIPMMRSMVMEYPEDPGCWQLDKQYMLGESLLVAPILNDEGIARYYLPEGTWTNIISGEKKQGACWVTENHDYMSLPLMARENSIIALGSVNSKPDYDYVDNLELHVFELKNKTPAKTVVNNEKGIQELYCTAERSNNKIVINVHGTGKPWKVVLRGIDTVVSTRGAVVESSSQGLVLIPDKEVRTIEVALK
jgi:alpha-D-xyloside xylohydrolase